MPKLTDSKQNRFSRRGFLAGSLTAVGAVAFGVRPCPAESETWDGFRLGIQSFSLRTYTFPVALQHARDLGLKHIEPYSKHIPISTVPSYLADQQALLAKNDITPDAFGVVAFDANENKAREVFEFAKALGLRSISANPKKESAVFDLLDRLVDEYQVPIAIHNHGPGALYDKVSDVMTWTKDRHPLLGACVDTGHYLRSEENPVDVIEQLGQRVFGCHLKDVKSVRDEAEFEKLLRTLPKKRANRLRQERKVMTIVGEGELDIAGVLAALKKQNYSGSLSLEYEENMENPLSDIAICLDNVRAAMKTLA